MTVTASHLHDTAYDEGFCAAHQRKYVLIASILASALGFIDGTVVAIALPTIRSDLGASLADVQWINNAYALTLSALILVGGAAGDRFGLRRIFVGGILFFIAASIACALAPTPEFLIGARAVQGIGAAFMVPGSLAIIAKTYPKDLRGKAIGLWAASSAITTALGPVIGGVLLEMGGDWIWRLIFAVNLPLGGIAIYLLLRHVRSDPADSSARLDWVGAVLATAALALFAWALTGSGGEGSVPETTHMISFGAFGVALLGAFIFWERRVAHPMVPLDLFGNLGFSVANIVTFLLYFSLSAVLFFLPMTLITGWGISEAMTVVLFAPLSIAVGLLSGPVGTVADRTGPWPLIGAGCAMVAVAYLGLGLTMPAQDLWWRVLPMMILQGFGMALVVAPLSTAVMGAVDDQEAGAASGINNAVSRVSGLIAVAALGGIAALGYQSTQGEGLPGFGAEAEALSAAHAAATNAAFAPIAYIAAALSAVAAAAAFAVMIRQRRA